MSANRLSEIFAEMDLYPQQKPKTVSFDQKFPLGEIVATPSALEALAAANQTALQFLFLHRSGDWGEVDEGDKRANDDAISSHPGRLVSAYRLATGTIIWIITEATRAFTTILLPEDY